MRNDYYSDVYKVKDLFSDLQKSKAGNCLMVKKPRQFQNCRGMSVSGEPITVILLPLRVSPLFRPFWVWRLWRLSL